MLEEQCEVLIVIDRTRHPNVIGARAAHRQNECVVIRRKGYPLKPLPILAIPYVDDLPLVIPSTAGPGQSGREI